MASGGETGVVNGDEVESLQKIRKTQANAETMDEKISKKSKRKQNAAAKDLLDLQTKDQDVGHKEKSKRKQNAAAKNLLDLQTKDQDVGHKDPTPSADNQREVEASSKRTKKTKSAKTSSKNKLNESNLEHEKDSGVEIDPLQAHTNSGTDKSPQVSLHTTEGNYKGRPVEDECAENMLPPAKKLPKTSRSGSGTDKSSQVPLHTTEDNYKGRPVEDKYAEQMLHPEKKLPKASRSGTTALQSSKSDKFTSIPEEERRPSTLNATETSINSEKKSEALTVSNSKLGNSKSRVRQNKLGNEGQSGAGQGVRKASVNDIGEVVNGSQNDKGVLAKLGAIFKDDSSGTSEDEDGDNSDASTRTPSDNSFSSDYSDGESNVNLSSPRNGNPNSI